MAILNMFSGSGGGVRIPLEPASNFSVLRGNAQNTVSWVDPVDKVANPGGEAVSTWAYDVLVRREGRYPTSPTDGYPIYRNTVKNQGGDSASYVDTGLTNGVAYYYALYSYSTIGVVSDPATGTATPIGEVSYSGTTSQPLTSPDAYVAAASVKDQYLIFGGGVAYTVAAYDSSLTRIASLSPVYVGGEGVETSALSKYAAGSTTNHAVFAKDYHVNERISGGSWLYNHYGSIVTYDSSLTRTYREGGLTITQSGCSFNNGALFVGGYAPSNSSPGYGYTYCYGVFVNDSLTETSFDYETDEDYYRSPSGVSSFGNYAVIGPGWGIDRQFGGKTNVQSYTIINTSLTRSARRTHGQMSNDSNISGFVSCSPTHGFVVGGVGSYSKKVTSINTSLTSQTATSLPDTFSCVGASGTKTGEFALFAGGVDSTASVAYDQNLVQTTHDNLSVPRSYAAAGHIGKYALFAGGVASGNANSAVVDVYTS